MTKTQMMHEVARISGEEYSTVRSIVKTMEYVAWSKARSGELITVIGGVKLIPVWVPERTKTFFGNPTVIPGHYRVKAKLTHHSRWQKEVNMDNNYTAPDEEITIDEDEEEAFSEYPDL